MRHRNSLANAVAAVVFAYSAAASSAPDAPFMGKGRLAVIQAEQDRADLVAIDSAVYEDGILYIDHHIRLRETAGDPPQVEMVAREVVDCRKGTMGHTSWQTANYHTGKQGGMLPTPAEVEMKPLNRGFFQVELCRRLIDGSPVGAALTRDHADALKQFPRFALSIRDALRPTKIEGGKILEAEETELLQHLRHVNPAF